ncbi:PadR family transcriptional regulator [Phenylobacterium sp.]|uniref:PadR family transcriptional regulator n=1 Tax=Phenylobacterium sp. TaxID=1871053 RepID=UPI002CD9D50F|nr:PadR family transcriptional regulator [Phenylobacterium sp.]HLZ75003.1 PadR family transcriptional regulator [Phenylobacterium sp.]
MATTNPSFMNGVPELLVLRLLRGREMYGYEIVQAIREETAEVVSLGEGVVYPVLHALERSGAITSERRSVGGRSRIYYALSPQGVSRLTELTELWSRITGAVGQVLVGGDRAGLV